MALKISVGIAMLALLTINFFELHDILEPKTVPEYMTGLISIPLLLLLGGLLTGALRLCRNESF